MKKNEIIEELDKLYKKYWDEYKITPKEARQYIDGILFGIGMARKIVEKA